MILWISCLLLAFCLSGETAKIGVFTAPLSKSHIQFSLSVADTLADAGHDVVVIRPTFNPECDLIEPKNPTIRQIRGPQVPPSAILLYTMNQQQALREGRSFRNIAEFGHSIRRILIDACECMASNKEFMAKIAEEEIELAFNHHLDLCQMAIAQHAGVRRWVSTNPGPMHNRYMWDMGQIGMPSLYPEFLLDNGNEMTVFERIQNSAVAFAIYISTPQMDRSQTAILREHLGNDAISVENMRFDAKLAFVNLNPLIEFTVPVTQRIRFIGGITLNTPQDLKEPFASFLKPEKTTVVISFGSAVRAADMSETWKKAFFELIESNSEFQFVIKYENDFHADYAAITGKECNFKNFLVSKWIPQSDLLSSLKNVVLITHSGYNSILEAARHAVPCVLIPISADQFRNAQLVESRGFGLTMKSGDFKNSTLLNARLNEVLGNVTYRERAQVMSRYMQMSEVRQELVKWTEFALTNEVPPLPNIPFVLVFMIDPFLILTVLLVVFALFVIFKLLLKLARCFSLSLLISFILGLIAILLPYCLRT